MNTVLIASVVATKYRNGGNAAAVLNWVQGFQRLGYQPYFVEQISTEHCVDERQTPVPFAQSANVAYFRHVMRDAGLEHTSALICDGGEQTSGLPYRDIKEIAGAADLLLNVTGHLTLTPLLKRSRRKAYLDLDPGYTQYWHASSAAGARLEGHDFYFTIGENIGTSRCAIPTSGIHWRHTRQPIVLSRHDVDESAWTGRFTTVASWRGPYGRVQVGATTFGLKVHEFRKFIDLPSRADGTFEIALDIHPADANDLRALQRHGWRIVNPHQVAPDPLGFDTYIRSSDAEWSVAQGIYVETHSGWFSDRSVRYLASGKPVVVQDTGLGRTYPVGEGMLTFQTIDEAVEAVKTIERDPHRHRQAARALAETYFDSDRVVGRMLEEMGVAA